MVQGGKTWPKLHLEDTVLVLLCDPHTGLSPPPLNLLTKHGVRDQTDKTLNYNLLHVILISHGQNV